MNNKNIVSIGDGKNLSALTDSEIEMIGGGLECECICKAGFNLAVVLDHHVCFGGCATRGMKMESCRETPAVQIARGSAQILSGTANIACGMYRSVF